MSLETKDRLSTQDRWEASYKPANYSPGPMASAKHWLRRALGERTVEMFKDYDEWLLWNVLYPKYLPRGAGLQVLEIGSAPGKHLIELHRRFGYEPFGVEYTTTGVEANRRVFAENGLKPENIFEADVFSEEFIGRFQGQFDVVISRGFIEHFADPKAVVRTHLAFLKPGGTLVIEVPNFRGIHYPWYLLFRRSVFAWHNFETMKARTFRRLFDPADLEARYSGSYGTLSLNMFMMPQNNLATVLNAIRYVPQALINFGLRFFCKRGDRRSPFLVRTGFISG